MRAACCVRHRRGRDFPTAEMRSDREVGLLRQRVVHRHHFADRTAAREQASELRHVDRHLADLAGGDAADAQQFAFGQLGIRRAQEAQRALLTAATAAEVDATQRSCDAVAEELGRARREPDRCARGPEDDPIDKARLHGSFSSAFVGSPSRNRSPMRNTSRAIAPSSMRASSFSVVTTTAPCCSAARAAAASSSFEKR